MTSLLMIHFNDVSNKRYIYVDDFNTFNQAILT